MIVLLGVINQCFFLSLIYKSCVLKLNVTGTKNSLNDVCLAGRDLHLDECTHRCITIVQWLFAMATTHHGAA